MGALATRAQPKSTPGATVRVGHFGQRPRVPGVVWFQVSIATFLIETPRRERIRVPVAMPLERRPVGRIVSMRLICGHDRAYQIERPSTSKRKTAPCFECGSKSSRREVERSQERYFMRRMLTTAIGSPERLDALLDALHAGLLIASTPPTSEEDERLRERMVAALSNAGISEALRGETVDDAE